MGISERARKVLGAVIQEYIMTAEPVGSKTLAMNYGLGIASATARAMLAELEDMGLLYQPHTSAGRVPTEAGFRFYVRDLLRPEEPAMEHKELLKRGCESGKPADALLHGAARTLSAITRCAGVMFVPRKDNFVIKSIKLVPVDASGIVVVLESRAGAVQTRFVRLDAHRSSSWLEGAKAERVNNYLNSIAGGLTLSELRGRIAREMGAEENLYDELLGRALDLGALALQEGFEPEDGVCVEGASMVLDQPEFRRDLDRMRSLFAAFQEKRLLVKILDKGLEAGGIHVWFGSDCDVREFEGLGFVTAACGSVAANGAVVGALGVFGPTRMDYSRIIPLLGYTAGLLGGALSEKAR